MSSIDKHGPFAEETRLIHAGRAPALFGGAVNIPPFRASTVLFQTLADLDAHDPALRMVRYGRTGNPSSHAFEAAITELEEGHDAVSFASGLQAITSSLLAFTRQGDHVLIADTAYAPTRGFANGILSRSGITVEYFDPGIGAGITALLRPTTRVVFLESPGSLTFEVQDVPAICAAVTAANPDIVLMIDNTWAAGLLFKPLKHGVHVSIQSATKYVGGHSDASLGVAVCMRQDHWLRLKKAAIELGACASADDLFLGLRGLRSLQVRLRRHHESGIKVARWLEARPEVTRVRHPALPDCPGHALWVRDFTGACGLFAFEIAPVPRPALAAMVDGMHHFGMGYSWGGFESLILPSNPAAIRTATPWAGGELIRLHIGLEDADDLIADLDAGFARLNAALEAK
ncbi:cystathionine beta-lyase [Niveispirillum lacus]|uniref:Cystathionine beta-lyase n=1 Tax=Niveispirillum lacus TaxID=1981099 RepID=A0A255YUK5_9PROT|nr:cystathionine beta-lyase [Niveispirillum lacus]OYQ32892.1 cystathionine beta-lyase [Niveispirillum lacus]